VNLSIADLLSISHILQKNKTFFGHLCFLTMMNEHLLASIKMIQKLKCHSPISNFNYQVDEADFDH